MSQTLLTHASIATMTANDNAYGLIQDGALVIDNGVIAWAGQHDQLPDHFKGLTPQEQNGRLITPALIDCHTHIVHGGNRAKEFEMYLQGASYADVARAGGGINSTVQTTRASSEADLLHHALPRIDRLISEGVGTIEIKSGYGLDIETELKMLRVARRIGTLRPITVVTSFLGAHALPPEFKDRPDTYIDEICIPALTKAHAKGLVDAVDGFCETIGFTVDQIRRVFECAQSLGLPVKLHAEQLSNMGGTAMAAGFNALSTDHLEFIDANSIEKMAEHGTVAVLLPGAFYALRETQKPPVDALRNAGVPMAIATDCNPGSSPLTSLLLAMNMACTLFRLTPEEALKGTTINAAKALGLKDRGQIKPGLRADLAIWNIGDPSELSYHIGLNPLQARYHGGTLCPQ